MRLHIVSRMTTETIIETRDRTDAAARNPVHQPVATATGWPGRVWLLLVVLGGVLFLDGLDVSAAGVALPSIGRDLGMAPSQLQWIVSGYVLGYGGLLLLGGRASDLLGRRRVLLVAVAVFGAASVVSALVSIDQLIIALRFVKGIAAAFTVPAGLSIITTTFAEGPARNKALSIYTVCGASGFSLGLVFGGLLTEWSWRATLFFPGPIALALLLIGLRVIPRSERVRFSWAQFDALGAASSTLAMLMLVFAVVRAPQVGWATAQTIGMLAGSVALLLVFVQVQRRHRHPLIRLGVLRSVRLIHANLSGMVMFGGYMAFQFMVTLYLQDSLHWSPIEVALGFLPAGLIVAASATKMDRVLDRVSTTVLIVIGLVAFLGAYLWFLRVQPGMGYADFLLPTIVLLGVGFALCFPSVNSQATAGIDDDEQGLASGLVNTSIQVGGAIWLAIITAILGSSGSTVRSGELLGGMQAGLTVIVGLTAAGLVATIAVLIAGGVRTRRARA